MLNLELLCLFLKFLFFSCLFKFIPEEKQSRSQSRDAGAHLNGKTALQDGGSQQQTETFDALPAPAETSRSLHSWTSAKFASSW